VNGVRSKLGTWASGGKSVEQGGYAMPATSAKQKKFMDIAAHNPAFAKAAGVPSKVAKEFSQSSKGMKFSKGGDMKESKAMMKKEVSFMKKKGAPKSMLKHEMAEAGMESGGMSKKLPSAKQMGNLGMKAGGLAAGHKSANGVAKRGLTKGTQVKMAKGGMTKKYC
jgi:hypothetical protein